jgi:hypothetical protein
LNSNRTEETLTKLTGNSEGKRSLGMHENRWYDKIKICAEDIR